MKFTALQIAALLEGEVAGDPQATVTKLSKIEEGEPGSLTFLSNEKYTSFLYDTKATIAIVNKTFVPEKKVHPTLIKVADAYRAFSKLLAHYNQVKNDKKGKESPCFISDSAVLGAGVYIGAFAYIGSNVRIASGVKIHPNCFIGDNAVIGAETTLFSGVKIYSETVVGKNCKIHAGAVLGSDGFGFAPDVEGKYKAIPHIGNVVIEDGVDIGANTTIDRATLGSTFIREGVKLDNLIQIAHNVEIGKHTVIAAQTAVAGSTKIGKNCMIGGQVAISGHLQIGDGVKIQGNTGVTKNIRSQETIKGSPAYDAQQWNRSYVHFKKLPLYADQIAHLERELKALKGES